MKNTLKKLGVLGLITFIIPFINVKAATTSCEGGELHLQNYLFLDVSTPAGFSEYINDGIVTYGNFPYTFPDPTEKTTVKVLSVTENTINNSNEPMYWSLYNSVLSYQQRYNIYLYPDDGNFSGKYFVNEANPNYSTDTILLHQRWGKLGESSESSKWPYFQERPSTLQSVDNSIVNDMSVNIYGTTYTTAAGFGNINNNSVVGNKNDYTNLANYFNSMIEGKNAANTTWYDQTTKHNYIPLVIKRQLDDNTFNDMIFGKKTNYETTNYEYEVFTSKLDDSKLEENSDKKYIKNINDIEDSYDIYLNYLEIIEDAKEDLGSNYADNEYYAKIQELIQSNNSDSDNDNDVYIYYVKNNDKDKVDFDIYENYYWPFVLNVEYEVCPINNSENPSNPVPEKEWTLKYDANVEDVTAVTNLPKPQTAKISQEITVDSGKPTMKGDYTFKIWCETRNGSGPCYNPGDKIKATDATTPVTLYAQWGPTTNVENPKQGVVSYIIGFAAVALIAGGIFLISKKKNLFKQI